jgi:predicted ATPase/DNA-binding XRE family transcriptional regulator
MHEDHASFGQQLRRFRLRAGLSQAALAERAGVAAAAVAALERGLRRTPYPQTLGALADALGLSPEDRADFAAAGTRPARPGGQASMLRERAAEHAAQLPAWLTSLVGRDAELATVRSLLHPSGSAARLLTLVGPGGVGKTRLAVAVAADLASVYRDGVVFVDLAPLRDTRLVTATVARAVGLREGGGRSAREQLLEHLRERHVLVVLDNFEHLLGSTPATALVTDLLHACPGVALLVTSRTALKIQGERRFALAPLATPAADAGQSYEAILASPAVQLFVERAQAVDFDFEPTPSTAGTVARVCRRLDGMPLAIELAAAWIRLLPPEALLVRLERSLPVLTGGATDLPERQQTLRNTVAWSHDLLGRAEQVLFRRLSVFAGGHTLEAAEAVCSDAELPADEVLDHLQVLADSSLVRRLDNGADEPRFGMLETVREYAELRLEESTEVATIRRRHRDWCVDWAERASAYLTGADQVLWYARVAREVDNFRAAREWSKHEPDAGQAELRLAAALGRFWWIRAPGREARQWLTEALERGPGEPSMWRARALTWSGQLESLHGDAVAGRSRLEQAVSIAREVGNASLLSTTLRHLALYSADQQSAVALLEEAVCVATAAHDQRELAFALAYLASAREWEGDQPTARELGARAVAAARAAGDPAALAEALLRIGSQKLVVRDFDAAVAIMQEALELSREIDYRIYITIIHWQLAWVALERDDLASARDHLLASLGMARDSANGADGLRPLTLAGRFAIACGRYSQGVRLLGCVQAWQNQHDLRPERTLWTRRWRLPGDEEALGVARINLTEEEFAAARTGGSLLSLEAALGEALDDARQFTPVAKDHTREAAGARPKTSRKP